jgi:glycosyltransferase involved in cell wall biosynthesis
MIQGSDSGDSIDVPLLTAKLKRAVTPDITVLIPSFNHERYVEVAIRSVLAQTYREFHVVVSDDGSTDGTVDRARAIGDDCVEVHARASNVGLGNNILAALARIDTPYVAILNSDDFFHPERLERCRRALEGQPDAALVATDVAVVDERGRALTPESVSVLQDGQEVVGWVSWYYRARQSAARARSPAEALLEHNFLVTSSNLFCRTAFLRRRAALLTDLRYCVDWQLFLDAAIEDALVYIPDELVGYRLHGANTVWFRRRERWPFLLEVNRVVARGVRRLLARAVEEGREKSGDQALVSSVMDRVLKNREFDGLALFFQELFSGGELEEAHVSPGLRGCLDELERRVRERWGAVTNLEEELRRVYASREWEIGHFVWNQVGLAKVGRALPQAVRRALAKADPVRRAGALLRHSAARILTRPVCEVRRRAAWGRAARWPAGVRGRAVVASCADFPIYSHTFVYEEMQGLRRIGLGVKVFCWKTNSRRSRQPAFRELWRSRVVLAADWLSQEEDLDYFHRRRPEQVGALLARVAAESGLRVEALLRDPIVRAGFTFARYVEVAGADYLHSYFFYDQSFMAMMAAYLLGIPRGITAYADHMLADFHLKCVRLHLELVDIVVATSRRIGAELAAIGGGHIESKIIVKPNGIDLSRVGHVQRSNRTTQGSALDLIAVNRIEPKKGLVDLVEAVRLLKDRGVSVRLHIVGSVDSQKPGSASYRDELERRVRELGVGDRVVLHGAKRQQEVFSLLAQSAIFVAPYAEVGSGDKDGIPTALLEAMGTGLPCVTTDAGSIPEVVTDGVEAMCVPQRDPVRLSEAIESLARDAAMRERMGRAARRRVETEFSVEVTEPRLHERIEALLARRGNEA